MIQPFWRYISTSNSRCLSLLIPGDSSHTGVQYEGGLAGDTVTGHYTFTYKTFLVNMNIKEKFSMTVTK